jgi:hypothetical protein
VVSFIRRGNASGRLLRRGAPALKRGSPAERTAAFARHPAALPPAAYAADGYFHPAGGHPLPKSSPKRSFPQRRQIKTDFAAGIEFSLQLSCREEDSQFIATAGSALMPISRPPHAIFIARFIPVKICY